MIKVLLTVAAFATFISASAQARSDKTGHYTVLGNGNSSCGQWIADRKENGWLARMDETWVQGFLTAYNLYDTGPDNVTKGIDSAGVNTWIDNYCAEHPLDSTESAAQALIVELTIRKN
jgi:hypothetical protein